MLTSPGNSEASEIPGTEQGSEPAFVMQDVLKELSSELCEHLTAIAAGNVSAMHRHIAAVSAICTQIGSQCTTEGAPLSRETIADIVELRKCLRVQASLLRRLVAEVRVGVNIGLYGEPYDRRRGSVLSLPGGQNV